jgi:hypothetical protein
VEEELFASGEDEVVPAIDTLKGLILKFHTVHPLASTW